MYMYITEYDAFPNYLISWRTLISLHMREMKQNSKISSCYFYICGDLAGVTRSMSFQSLSHVCVFCDCKWWVVLFCDQRHSYKAAEKALIFTREISVPYFINGHKLVYNYDVSVKIVPSLQIINLGKPGNEKNIWRKPKVGRSVPCYKKKQLSWNWWMFFFV